MNISADSSHLGWRLGSANKILRLHSRTMHAIFALNRLTRFRGKKLYMLTLPEHLISLSVFMRVRNGPSFSLKCCFPVCFHVCVCLLFFAFGLAVLLTKIFLFVPLICYFGIFNLFLLVTQGLMLKLFLLMAPILNTYLAQKHKFCRGPFKDHIHRCKIFSKIFSNRVL